MKHNNHNLKRRRIKRERQRKKLEGKISDQWQISKSQQSDNIWEDNATKWKENQTKPKFSTERTQDVRLREFQTILGSEAGTLVFNEHVEEQEIEKLKHSPQAQTSEEKISKLQNELYLLQLEKKKPFTKKQTSAVFSVVVSKIFDPIKSLVAPKRVTNPAEEKIIHKEKIELHQEAIIEAEDVVGRFNSIKPDEYVKEPKCRRRKAVTDSNLPVINCPFCKHKRRTVELMGKHVYQIHNRELQNKIELNDSSRCKVIKKTRKVKLNVDTLTVDVHDIMINEDTPPDTLPTEIDSSDDETYFDARSNCSMEDDSITFVSIDRVTESNFESLTQEVEFPILEDIKLDEENEKSCVLESNIEIQHVTDKQCSRQDPLQLDAIDTLSISEVCLSSEETLPSKDGKKFKQIGSIIWKRTKKVRTKYL